MIHEGGCHCGNLRLTLRLTKPPEEVKLRACGCSFCRAHATRTASDPEGAAEVWASDWDGVEKYRFGSATADYLLCRTCGVYIGAVCTDGDRAWAVINTNSLNDRASFTGTAAPVIHDGEPTDARMARRIANWTPTIIHR